MTDITSPAGIRPRVSGLHTGDAAKARLKGRYAAEARFKWIGAGAVALSALFLVLLLSTIVKEALPAFRMNYLTLPIDLSAAKVDPANPGAADYATIAQDALAAKFPGVESRQDRRLLRGLLSTGSATSCAGTLPAIRPCSARRWTTLFRSTISPTSISRG